MTTTTGMRPTQTIRLDGEVRTARKADLFGAFASGSLVGLWHHRSGGYIHGHIQQVRLESGYTPPDAPRHLLVTLLVESSALWLHGLDSQLVEIYVRADD